ncbi:WD40 repeat domain-containing protein, partial [Micromonospora zhanjiangensis]
LADGAGAVGTLAAVPLPDGRTLLAVGDEADHSVRLHDPTTGLLVARFTGHTVPVRSVATVPLPNGGTLVATGSPRDRDRDPVRLWDPLTGTQVGAPLHAAVGPVAALPMPDGRTLLAAPDQDGALRLWDPVARAVDGRALDARPEAGLVLVPVPSPDGRALLAGHSYWSVRLWDADARMPLGPALVERKLSVLALAALPGPDGSAMVVTGAVDGTVRFQDAGSGALRHLLPADEEPVLALAAHDGRLAVGRADGIAVYALSAPDGPTVSPPNGPVQENWKE